MEWMKLFLSYLNTMWGGVKMELLNKFPKGFFTIPCEIAKPTRNPDDKIIPIKWQKNDSGKKIMVKSAKEGKK